MSQAATMLLGLADSSGEVVTSENLELLLWPAKAPVESGQRIRDLVMDLRRYLSDSKEAPQFIETIPRVGYRFVGSVEPVPSPEAKPAVGNERVQPSEAPRLPWRKIAVGGVAVAAVLAVAILASQAANVQAPRIRREMLWQGPAIPRLGGVSRDGRLLCYSDSETENLNIRNLNDGRSWPVTHRPTRSSTGGVKGCIFSPDGERVAYRKVQDQSIEIHDVSTKGYGDRMQFSSRQMDVAPTDWSPDNFTLALAACPAPEKGQILLLNTRSGDVTNRIPTGSCAENAKFSPDGLWIAYDAQRSTQAEGTVAIVAASGARPPRELAAGPKARLLGGWVPNGSGIVVGSEGSAAAAYVIPIKDGLRAGSDRILNESLTNARVLAISSNGDIYLATQTSVRDTYVAAIDVAHGRLIRKPQRAFDLLWPSAVLPDWSPDGRELAFVPNPVSPMQESRNSSILIRRDDSVTKIEHQAIVFDIGALHWSADGQSLLVSGTGAALSGVYRFHLSTGRAEILRQSSNLGESYHDPLESFNGAIYFKLRQYMKEPSPVYAMTGGGKSPDELFLPSVYSYALSQDRRLMAYSTVEGDYEFIRLVDLATGKEREIHREEREGRIVSVGLTPDSKFVLYAQRGQLWKIPLDGGRNEQLPLHEPVMRDLRLHPDGVRIAFTAGDPDKSDVWVVKLALPPAH